MSLTLAEVFEQLTVGELAQVSSGGLEGLEIRPEDYQKVIAHVNLALTELHKRFHLRTNEILVRIYENISFYRLHPKYAQSNTLSPELYKYILDSDVNPFQDDVLKIEEVYNEAGDKVCLNDKTAPCSLFTPNYNTIQVPFPFDSSLMGVEYRANHPKIQYVPGMDPDSVEVDLPWALLEPLLIYVGYRVLRSMGGEAASEGLAFMQLFESSCLKIHELGLEITPHYSNHKLDYRGWV